MQEDEAVRQRGNYAKLNQGDHGETACFESATDKPCTRELKMIIDACRSLRADALVLEMDDHTTVAVMNVYDGTYATATCRPDAHPLHVVRGLQVRLYSSHCVEGYADFLPAATVRSALGRWERQIAVVFGRHYAAALLSRAMGTKRPGEMSYDDLESVRFQISSAIGGCLLLEKVDK
jgi:hypothetical protein